MIVIPDALAHVHMRLDDGTHVHVNLADGNYVRVDIIDDDSSPDLSYEERRMFFIVPSSLTIKSILKKYSEKRGVSLRSLRFSYRGKNLFMSSIGYSTLKEMGMLYLIAFHTRDITAPQQTNADGALCDQSEKKSKSKKIHRGLSHKAKKSPSRKDHAPVASKEVTMSCKIAHSKQLTKLHEEAEPRLKSIRKWLNELNLKCQQRKQENGKEKQVLATNHDAGSFHKAGTTVYIVTVGYDKGVAWNESRLVRSAMSCLS